MTQPKSYFKFYLCILDVGGEGKNFQQTHAEHGAQHGAQFHCPEIIDRFS